MTIADRDVYPHVELLPEARPERTSHRGTMSGGWPNLSAHPGLHVRARRSIVPYLAVVLLPLAGALLILLAVHLFAHPAAAANLTPANVPVSVSPSACTFPDGS
jgi:hypothetical protein